MARTLTYTSPPVIELVLGAQFEPLPKLAAGHFGAIWQAIGKDVWVSPSDAMEIESQFERFGSAQWVPSALQLRLLPATGPGRMVVANAQDDRIVQVQRNRLHLNWRKRDGSYPSYTALIAEFLAVYDRFAEAVIGLGLGDVRLDQWELTYIDAFPKGEYWETPSEWPAVLPGLFGDLFLTDGLPLGLERRGAEWSFEIAPQRGRLHVSAQAGQATEADPESLLLNMTARGPIAPAAGRSGLVDGLALGHEVALAAFERSASEETRARWGIKK